MEQQKFLKLLADKYPTIQSASTEIINLRAILNLPKGTEHFVSDIHGEYEEFLHILKNASGVIKTKIDETFGKTLPAKERNGLATLIYYPEEKLKSISPDHEWYSITLYRLIEVCKQVAAKYTRSKVRKALPKDFEYIIDELLHCDGIATNKEFYYTEIIETIIALGRADAFIIQLAKLIQRFAIDHLHIVGDIFDRGPRPDIILEKLITYHSIDVQWGNHDIVWMGAAFGSEVCAAIVVANCLKYNNCDVLEDGYGINLRQLDVFARDFYGSDNCTQFQPKGGDNIVVARMHKAISIIRFKLEDQLKIKYPEFMMENMTFIDKIDAENSRLAEFEMNDSSFPTLDKDAPFELTKEEKEVIKSITNSFVSNEKLQRHTAFLMNKGSLYLTYNSNLLFHGCVPLNSDGTFTEVQMFGNKYSGKPFFEFCEKQVKTAYRGEGETKKQALDFIWYLWCGENSPLFGKSKMASFERFFLVDKTTHDEYKNPYFKLQENEEVCDMILKEWDLDPAKSHIINGHTPVKFKKGENPVRANGKMIVIDGGMSKPYREKTGIAGYTLIYNSYGLLLTAHQHFVSIEDAITNETDIISTHSIVENVGRRITIAETDIGKRLKSNIDDLTMLLKAYKNGDIKEK
ncbi:MAG: fructose-1,6-bisphosphatase [Ruminococcaceae bacterium]|nr:fructose-1,6-bisphosphatase [Oscillospiraceae bacterium]